VQSTGKSKTRKMKSKCEMKSKCASKGLNLNKNIKVEIFSLKNKHKKTKKYRE